MTREEFIKRAMDVKNNWLDANFEKNLNKILDAGLIDLEKIPDNYRPIYPAVAAILENVADNCIYGSTGSRGRRRMANQIKRFVYLV